MKTTLILAADDEYGIGKEGKLPWHHPEDLKRFKALTKDAVLIMGRKTFGSLPGILPGRPHVVVSKNTDWVRGRFTPGEIHTAGDLETAHKLARQKYPEKEIFIIGGATLYDHYLRFDLADVVELTKVLGKHDCDVKLDQRGIKRLRNPNLFQITKMVKPNNELTYFTYERIKR